MSSQIINKYTGVDTESKLLEVLAITSKYKEEVQNIKGWNRLQLKKIGKEYYAMYYRIPEVKKRKLSLIDKLHLIFHNNICVRFPFLKLRKRIRIFKKSKPIILISTKYGKNDGSTIQKAKQKSGKNKTKRQIKKNA